MTVWSNYSGTIAPPHPFFDTVWYPVLFAAEKLWNRQAVRDGFDTRFAAAFFGVAEEALFHGPTADRYARIERVSRLAKRHRYEAEVLRVMELTSVYRLKALTIGRELYKLRMPVTDAEKTIVRNRRRGRRPAELLNPRCAGCGNPLHQGRRGRVGSAPASTRTSPVPGLSRRKG